MARKTERSLSKSIGNKLNKATTKNGSVLSNWNKSLKKKMENFLEHWIILILTTSITVYALVADDIR